MTQTTTKVQGDWLPEGTEYEAMLGDPWNGWAAPEFDKATADRVMADQTAEHLRAGQSYTAISPMWYDAERDAYFTPYMSESEALGAVCSFCGNGEEGTHIPYAEHGDLIRSTYMGALADSERGEKIDDEVFGLEVWPGVASPDGVVRYGIGSWAWTWIEIPALCPA